MFSGFEIVQAKSRVASTILLKLQYEPKRSFTRSVAQQKEKECDRYYQFVIIIIIRRNYVIKRLVQPQSLTHFCFYI